MKKILCLLGILFIFASPALAKGIKYVTNLPYEPYTEEINLEKISNDSFKNNFVSIEKNKYKFKYLPKMGYGYEYMLVNKSNKDITLKGVNTSEFYNKDVSNTSNKTMKNLAKATFSSGKIWIPVYGIIYGVRCDKEKNTFIHDFPINITVKPNNKVRILASATKQYDNPIAEFVFTVNNKEQKVSF